MSYTFDSNEELFFYYNFWMNSLNRRIAYEESGENGFFRGESSCEGCIWECRKILDELYLRFNDWNKVYSFINR